jgi:hypothetical protein
MKGNTKSRRAFVKKASSLAGLGATSLFLTAASPLSGLTPAAGGTDREGFAGKGFLQVTLFEGITADAFRQFTAAVDQYYSPVLLKARGLVSYERFRHFDLPQTLELHLWESRDLGLAFYDGDAAQRAWKLAMDHVPPKVAASIPKDYIIQHHSDAHRHYILSKSFKS